MAKGFKAGGGGGTPLNFKIVGNPKPESPKENTIWVDTDKAIPEWMISANEPSGMRAEKKSVGSVVTMNDASEAGFTALTLYGKTTQNGTPTPDAPVPLVTPGADGSLAVTVCGKNLLKNNAVTNTINGITFTVNQDGSVTVNGTATAAATFILYEPSGKYVGKYNVSGSSDNCTVILRRMKSNGSYGYTAPSNGNVSEIELTESDTQLSFRLQVASGATARNETVYPMFRIAGTGDNTYEPYKDGGTLTAKTPNGLPGVPVSSGGNFTDENGQMWICDEIDFARGKYVKRLAASKDVSTFSGSPYANNVGTFIAPVKADAMSTGGSILGAVMCDRLPTVTGGSQFQSNISGIASYSGKLFISVKDVTTLDGITEWIQSNPITIVYALATPIETDLTTEELAQYSALHTNAPNTTIYNEGADMKVGYVSAPKDGFVWIKTGASSSTEFNALRKNGISVYPLAAKQCVDGKMVDKTAQIYQGGKWDDWLTYLVHDGIDNTSLTGGWFWNKSSAAASVDASDGAIRISCYNDYGAITWEYMTNNPVDLTEVKTIELLCDANASVGSWPSDGGGGGYIDLCCKSSKTANAAATARIATQSSVTGKTITLDVSNLSGNYYVSFYAYTYAERFYLSTNIYNLLFQK